MKKTLYSFIEKDGDVVFDKVDAGTTKSGMFHHPVLIYSTTDPALYLYSEDKHCKETVSLISRERTPDAINKYLRSSELLSETEAKLLFKRPGTKRNESYLLDYSSEDIDKYCKYLTNVFDYDEKLTIYSTSQQITCKRKDIIELSSLMSDSRMYKIMLIEDDNKLKVQLYTKTTEFKTDITVDCYMEEVVFNMDTGLTYHLKTQSINSVENKLVNITTGNFYNDFFDALPQIVVDNIFDIMHSYFAKTLGETTPYMFKQGKSISISHSLKAYNYNPFYPQLYTHKSMFGTQFRKIFKRNDETPYKTYAKILKLDYDTSIKTLMDENINSILLLKYMCVNGYADQSTTADAMLKYLNADSPIYNILQFEYKGTKTDYNLFENYYYKDFTKYFDLALYYSAEGESIYNIMKFLSNTDTLQMNNICISLRKLFVCNCVDADFANQMFACDSLEEYSSVIKRKEDCLMKSPCPFDSSTIDDSLSESGEYTFKVIKDTRCFSDNLLALNYSDKNILFYIYQVFAESFTVVAVEQDLNQPEAILLINADQILKIITFNYSNLSSNPYCMNKCLDWCNSHSVKKHYTMQYDEDAKKKTFAELSKTFSISW